METQKADLQHEMKAETEETSLLIYDNKPDTDKSFRCSIKKEEDEAYVCNLWEKILKPKFEEVELIDIKFENEEESQCNSNESNEKEILDEHLVPELIKKEEIDNKSEEEWNQFCTNEFNEKQIQDDYFDFKSIMQEETDIKTEDEEGDAFSTESLPVESEELPMYKCIPAHVLGHMPKPSECSLCPYKSNNKHNLLRHQRVHVPEEQAKLHKCPYCLFISKRRCALTKHLLIHKNSDDVTWYQCPECPFNTILKSNLEIHISFHRKGRPMYKCTFCSYFSFKKCYLQKHLDCVHKPDDPPLISCPEAGCLYKTHIQTYLQTHIKRLHKCQKDFKCSKCSYKTQYAHSLKAHELRHEDQSKWFSCALCPYKATTISSLNKHSQIHHSGSEIKWFQCSQCPFKTKHKESLAEHKLKHSSKAKEFTGWFYCYVCTWKSYSKHTLAKHIRIKHRDADCRIRGHL